MRRGHATTARFSIAFKLIASTIYITEDMVNGQTDFPSDDGTFAILHSAPGCSFKVDGDTSTQSLSSSTSAFANMRRSASSTISKFNSVGRKRSFDAAHSMSNYSLKVTMATIFQGKIGRSIREMYFNIDEETANVTDITTKIREGFGEQNLILVQPNGLRIEDANVTRELAFWKKSARKIYAVDRGGLTIGAATQSNRVEEKLGEIDGKLEDIKQKLNNSIVLQSGSEDSSSSLANALRTTLLVRPLRECFTCIICRDLMPRPVNIALCCKQLIGCSICIQRWGRDHCPHCRAEDYTTIEVSNFDNILAILPYALDGED